MTTALLHHPAPQADLFDGDLGGSKGSRCFSSHPHESGYNPGPLAGGTWIDAHLGSRQEIDKDQDSESEKLGSRLGCDLFSWCVFGQPFNLSGLEHMSLRWSGARGFYSSFSGLEGGMRSTGARVL